MASGSVSGYYRSYQVRSDWSSTPNTAGNYSDLTINHYLVCPSGWSLYIGSRTNSCTCGEYKEFSSGSISTGGGTTIHLGTTYHRVYHNSDGKKTVNLSTTFNMKATISGTYVGSITASGDITLDNIPRYTTVSQSVRETGDNYFYMNWSTTDPRDYTQYSLNGGAWTDAGDTVASDSKSGYYRVGNLSPNTTYTIKTRCRRTDSQLWSETGSTTITTLSSPYINALSDFNIGTSFSCSIYNPKGRTLNLYLYANGVSDVIVRTTNINGTYTFVTTENENNALYNAIPNTKNGTYRIAVVCSDLGTTNWSNNSVGYKNFYTVENNCKPSASITAQDINETTLALTGDSSKVIKYFSTIRAILTSTTQKGASISSQKIVCNDGKNGTGSTVVFYEVESATFVGTVTDSRGYIASATRNLTLVDYIKLTLNIDVYRVSPTSGSIVAKFNGNYFNNNFGRVDNTLNLKYRYKENGSGVWGQWIQLNPIKSGNTYSNGSTAISLGANFDYQKSYDFEFVATDKIYSNGEISAFTTVVNGLPIYDWGEDDFNINGKLNLYETSIIRHIANIMFPTGSIYISLTQSYPEWLAGEWVLFNTIVSNGTTYYVYKRTNENERIYYNDELLLYNGEEIYIENTLLKGSDVL